MTERDSTVREIRRLLQSRASPRLHMLTLVTVTAAVGLASSFLLLKAGVTMMVFRYPLAVAIAYLAFLGLVSLWLRRFRLRERERAGVEQDVPGIDLLQIPVDAMWSPSASSPSANFGGGGGFSGGGASGTWEGAGTSQTRVPPPLAAQVSPTTFGGGSSGTSWDFDFDSDGWWLIVAALIAAIAFSILLYVVWIAPTLFAELLLDAGLAAGLYRRLANIERRTWLATAVRQTVIPAAAIASLLGLGGFIMQAVYPDAVSIGRVVDHVRASRAKQPNER